MPEVALRSCVSFASLNSVMHQQQIDACKAVSVRRDGQRSRSITQLRVRAAIVFGVIAFSSTFVLERSASAQVGVGGAAVTGLGGDTSPSETVVNPSVLATIPTAPGQPVPQTQQSAPPQTVPPSVKATTKAGRTTTLSKKRTTTTRRIAGTSAPTTVLILEPLQTNGVSTVPPIEVGAPDSGMQPTGAVNPQSPQSPSNPSTLPPPTSASKGGTTSTGPSTTMPASTPAELKARIEREVALAGGAPGVLVLIDDQKVADMGSTQPKLPASTQKLYVAAASLNLLGPDYRFETIVRADSNVAGTVQSLTLIGAGDPSFSTANLRSLASAVKAAGINTVAARLTVDDSRYDRATTAQGWKPSFSPGESGILNAVMIDGNHRNDAVFLTDPAIANLSKFQQELTRAGVVSTTAVLSRSPAASGSTMVASHRSEALSSLVTTMAKKSNNTYAEMLLKEVGFASGNGGSTNGGAATIASHLAQLGVAAPPRIADGSGLSSLNRTTAASEVSLLLKADSGKQRATFRASLPVACVDGTMKSRLCGTAGSGVVIAKTGTIDNVAALSGYATTATGRKVVFSFLLNGLRSSSTGRVAIDRAILQIITYTG